MSYIRIKQIGTNSYAYLVENIHTKNGPRQKVKQYIGRTYIPKRERPTDPISNSINTTEFLHKLVVEELSAHGFTNQKENLLVSNITFHKKKMKLTRSTNKKTQKEAVLQINQGFLCSHTLQKIFSFTKTNDLEKDAFILAKHFLTAGLNVTEKQFIEYYTLL